MFLRFVTTRTDEDSHKPQGVFVASYALLDSGELNAAEHKQLREIQLWFSQYLPTPPKKFSAGRAIFWFKASAGENIRNIWELVYLLRQHGFYVEIYMCRRLGNICYEDEFQAAAYPSKLDGKITVQ